jgi:hypothetical protein
MSLRRDLTRGLAFGAFGLGIIFAAILFLAALDALFDAALRLFH